MQAQLQCEHCGKTPDQTEFSTKMVHRSPLSRAKAVQFESVHLYLPAVPQPQVERLRCERLPAFWTPNTAVAVSSAHARRAKPLPYPVRKFCDDGVPEQSHQCESA